MKGFQKPKRLACDMETLTDSFGHFHAQPFERGFGTTFGNALSRILLSAFPNVVRECTEKNSALCHRGCRHNRCEDRWSFA